MSQRPRAPMERGASAVEYAILIAGIAAVIVLAVYALGGSVTSLFDTTCDNLARERDTAACE